MSKREKEKVEITDWSMQFCCVIDSNSGWFFNVSVRCQCSAGWL